MKKAKASKTKTNAKRAHTAKKPVAAPKSPKRRVRSEPAMRSEAFSKAVEDAKSYMQNSERLRGLLDEAINKVATVPREPFKEVWAYLQAMLRLLRAYYRDEYQAVPTPALLSIIAAVAYLVNPFDLIPDVVPFLGFLDDAAVVIFAVRKTRDTLDDFMLWETLRG